MINNIKKLIIPFFCLIFIIGIILVIVGSQKQRKSKQENKPKQEGKGLIIAGSVMMFFSFVSLIYVIHVFKNDNDLRKHMFGLLQNEEGPEDTQNLALWLYAIHHAKYYDDSDAYIRGPIPSKSELEKLLQSGRL